MRNLSKTAVKLFSFKVNFIRLDQPRLVKAVKELERLGLVQCMMDSNDFGYTFFRLTWSISTFSIIDQFDGQKSTFSVIDRSTGCLVSPLYETREAAMRVIIQKVSDNLHQ